MRISGVSPQFQPPSNQAPSRRMWVILVLCVALPPVGLILLWTTARNPLRGKLIISTVALVSMTLMLTVYLLGQRTPPNMIKTGAMDYSYLEEYHRRLQEQQMAEFQKTQPQTQPQTQAPQDDLPSTDGVIPQNPMS